MKSNRQRAEEILRQLAGIGVEELVLCPGSRNSPLVLAAESGGSFRLWTHFEERSAAFFAVGRMMRDAKPVAVITTSGTAAAELLPAAIEAYYNALPLILVTADRPENYRGTGSPQAIEQKGLFGVYAEESIQGWSRNKPLHLNIPFEEPLTDATFS